jgi:hypothetical protein
VPPCAAGHRPKPHVVKRAIPKYNAHGTIDRSAYKATIDITITAHLTADGEP